MLSCSGIVLGLGEIQCYVGVGGLTIVFCLAMGFWARVRIGWVRALGLICWSNSLRRCLWGKCWLANLCSILDRSRLDNAGKFMS